MNFSSAQDIYNILLETGMVSLRIDLFKTASRYAQIRVEWQLADPEKRKEMELSRTAAHNAFIDACNILSRNMARAGEDTSWRSRLGNDRKVIGDFACYLHCILGVRAR